MEFNYYEKLKAAYLNEVNCPELLPYEVEVVHTIESEIQEHEGRIEEMEESGDARNYFQSRILMMGLERTKYLLSSYLHARLSKIEEFVTHFLQDEEVRARLSVSEEEYATKYEELIREYYHESALHQLPPAFTSLNEPEMICQPNLDAHVICRIDDAIGDVEIEAGGSSVHFEKGDVVAIRYRPIRGLVLTKKISFC